MLGDNKFNLRILLIKTFHPPNHKNLTFKAFQHLNVA